MIDGEKAAIRWRSIRNSFVNSRKPRPSGDEGDGGQEYIYSNELNFLLPMLEERPGYK